MYNSGDAADQMVRYAYQGGEVVLKLTGAGAKNLAAYLANVLKNPNSTPGQTKLKRMIRDGKELAVQPLPANKLREFREEAKRYGVSFCVLKDRKGNNRTYDILVRAEDASRVNRIMDNLGIDNILYGHIRSEKTKKKENPTQAARSGKASRITSSRPSRSSSISRSNTRGNGRTTIKRPSVAKQLAAFAAAIGRESQRSAERSAEKQNQEVR